MRRDGDAYGSMLTGSRIPTTTYRPRPWEEGIGPDRVSFYEGIGALSCREGTRDRATLFVLSFESILRRERCVALPVKGEAWTGKISARVPKRFLKVLRKRGLLVPLPVQCSGRPNTYTASSGFLASLPECPPRDREGRQVRDGFAPVVVKADGKRIAVPSGFEGITAEMEAVNAWLVGNAHRVTGVDDLRFHRVFQDGSPERGGRLYGEFSNMPRRCRPFVLIDGRETAEPDLSAAFLSIYLYRMGRETLPPDPYAHGPLAGMPRRFVKLALSFLFGRGSWWHRAFPKELLTAYGKEEDARPTTPTLREFRDTMEAAYPEFARFPEGEFAIPRPTHRLEWYESRALLDTLDTIRKGGEVGLPIHDGIRVRADIAGPVEDAFRYRLRKVCLEDRKPP